MVRHCRWGEGASLRVSAALTNFFAFKVAIYLRWALIFEVGTYSWLGAYSRLSVFLRLSDYSD